MSTPSPYASPLTNQEAHSRVLLYILDSVEPNGCWGSSDFEDWAPIITALTVDVLLRNGLTSESEWWAGSGPTLRSLKDCIAFLDSNIRDDGTFGEDLWDAVKLAHLALEHNLQKQFSRLGLLEQHIAEATRSNSHRRLEKTWDGPGVLAALVDYFDLKKEHAVADRLFNELNELHRPTGEFRGACGPDQNDLTSPTWHSAQALVTYLNRGISESDDRIKRLRDWLCSQQTARGSWSGFSRYEIYFTAYAVMALSRLQAKPVANLTRAIHFLHSSVNAIGKAGDAGGTLMVAVAFGSYYGFGLPTTLSIAELQSTRRLGERCSLLESELRESKERAAKTDGELEVYRKKFGDAAFGVTVRQAFVFGAILGLVSLLLALATLPWIPWRQIFGGITGQNVGGVSTSQQHTSNQAGRPAPPAKHK